jgi:hypothetical protein
LQLHEVLANIPESFTRLKAQHGGAAGPLTTPGHVHLEANHGPMTTGKYQSASVENGARTSGGEPSLRARTTVSQRE